MATWFYDGRPGGLKDLVEILATIPKTLSKPTADERAPEEHAIKVLSEG